MASSTRVAGIASPGSRRLPCPRSLWLVGKELLAKALDWALHFQRISLDSVGNPPPGLLGMVGIKLNTVANRLGAAGDRLEGHAVADTGVNSRRQLFREQQESTNPLGFGQGKWVETESTFALKAQGRPPFSEDLARWLWGRGRQ